MSGWFWVITTIKKSRQQARRRVIESRGVRNLLSQLSRQAIDQRDYIQRTHAKGKKAQIWIDQCTTRRIQ